MNRKGTRKVGTYFKDPCRKARRILRGYLCCKVEYITIITPHWHPPFPEWRTASDLSGPAPAPSNFQLAHIFETSLSNLWDIFVTSYVIFCHSLTTNTSPFATSVSHVALSHLLSFCRILATSCHNCCHFCHILSRLFQALQLLPNFRLPTSWITLSPFLV